MDDETNRDVLIQVFSDIADAIREHDITGTMTPAQMADKIDSIIVSPQMKYGIVLDDFIGDVDGSGKYDKPGSSGTTCSFYSTDIVKIGEWALGNTSTDFNLGRLFFPTRLTEINLPNLTEIMGYGMKAAFSMLTQLQNVDMHNLTTISTDSLMGAFYGCTGLKTVDLAKLSTCNNTQSLNQAFQGCTGLEIVDFSEATSIPSLSNINAFSDTNDSFRIIVPNSLYDSWILATNWVDNSVKPHIVKASEALGVKFVAKQAGSTISLNKYGTPYAVSLSYSTDSSTWSSYTLGNTITLTNVDDYVIFVADRGQNSQFTNNEQNFYYFSTTGQIEIGDDSTYNFNPYALANHYGSKLQQNQKFLKLFGANANLTGSFKSNIETIYAAQFQDICRESGITSVDFPNLTSVEQSGLQYAFSGCTALTSVDLSSVTSSVQGGFNSAFYGCTALTSVDLSNVTTGVGDAFNNTFNGCTSLTSVDLSSLSSVGNRGLRQTFYSCSSLTSVDLSNLSSVGSYGLYEAFYNCSSLTSVDLSSLSSAGTNGLDYAFGGCTSLTSVDLSSLSSVNQNGLNNAFNGCSSLEVVYFRNTTSVPPLSNINAFENTNNTYKIIVPDALYDDWINATNWSHTSIVSHIVRVSDYQPQV